MVLSLEDRKEFIKKYQRYFDRYLKFCTASLHPKNIPDFEMALDDQSYTDHRIVHIGIGEVPAESEEELIRWTMYLIGHECQHCLSTTQKSWMHGIKGGFRSLCEAISKHYEKVPRKFHKNDNYDHFFDAMKALGYNLSPQALKHFVHFIANSLEDGRIERIRSIKRPRYKNYVISIRGKEWNLEPVDEKMKDNLDNPRNYLSIILNQILTLATTSVYQKGFVDVAGKDMHIHEILQQCIPHIDKAVGSPSCRGCMNEAIEICKILAVEIAEASKKTPLEEILENLIRSFVENQSFTADASTEETCEEEGTPLFGFSDLSKEDKTSDSLETSEKTEDNSSEPQSETNSSDMESSISDLIQSADEHSNGEVQSTIMAGNINKTIQPKKDIEGDSEPQEIDLSNVNIDYDYHVDFSEEKRTYHPNTSYPVELLSQANVLKQKVERLFRNKISPNLRGQKRGRLDNALLYKIAMGEGEIFKKKQNSDEFDGCCYILIDNSGSMGDGKDSKRYYCCRAVSIIEHAFQNIMPVKIDAFDARGNGEVRHSLIKNWTEKVSNNASWNFYVNDQVGWGNKDGYSIRVATQELLSRPEKKKMLFVLSDGLPSDYSNGYEEGAKDVNLAVKYARKNGIETTAIYFGNDLDSRDVDVFIQMYESNYIISEPDQLIDPLVRTIKRFCFR